MTKRKSGPVKRYYAQFSHVAAPTFLIKIIAKTDEPMVLGGWFVYDRDFTSGQGAPLIIAVTSHRSNAFRIRDALNAVEN